VNGLPIHPRKAQIYRVIDAALSFYASKSGNRRLISAWALGQRPAGGDLQSSSSRMFQAMLGPARSLCGKISIHAEQTEHSMVASF
jgi:hypothetical protein